MLAFVPKKVIIYPLAVVLLNLLAAVVEAGVPVRNMNPLSIYVGLPELQSAKLLMDGQQLFALNTSINSHFIQEKDKVDALVIDGESYVGEFGWQRGFDSWAAAVVVPYISYQKGFMDAAIINWHNAFHLPGDNREKVADDQLLIRYAGKSRFLLDEPAQGLGDVRLTASKPISRQQNYQHALHITLKLPTGNYHDGLGSGGTDLAIYTTHAWQQGNWQETLQAGVLGMEKPKILAEQRRKLAGFGTAALDYTIAAGWVITVQYDMHTALYKDTHQPALGNAFWLSTGLRHQLPDWAWHIVLIEDAGVHTVPDVGFQFGVQFGEACMEW